MTCLESGKVNGLLANMTTGERGNKVIDGYTHRGWREKKRG